jgi:universal stress protein A
MKKTYRTVLAPTDFSPGSRAAVQQLERLWPAGTHARVHLVHVLEPLGFAAPPAPIWIDYNLAREDDARRRLDRVAARLRQRLGPAVKVAMHVPVGVAHNEICRLAAKLRADLIVLGTHGRTGLTHVLVGSVAERVVRHARCPVLTVPLAGTRRRRG